MSVAELKSELNRLSPEERRQISAYLYFQERMTDPEFQVEITRKMEDRDPSHWVALEEVEKRLTE